MWKVITLVVIILCNVVAVLAEEMDCYGSGSIAGAVIGTFIATLIVIAVIYVIYKKIWKARHEKHLVLETDAEKGDTYAFDNPGFKDAGLTPMGKVFDKQGNKIDSGKHKWSQWSPLGALVSTKNEKKKTADDSCLEDGETKFVTLRSHDFTGLGFNIYGNMRDGIFIKDVLHRGPASESGKLNPGDKINSLRISFEHMVYEDALAILSYASPYEVEIEAKSGVKNHGPSSGQGAQPGHPLYRSSSSTDLIKIGKSARYRLFQDSLENSAATDYSTLPLSSNNTSLERSQHKTSHSEVNSLTKPERNKKPPPSIQPSSKSLTPEQLKSQLEHNLAQKISSPNDMYPNYKKMSKEPVKTESEVQNTEVDKANRFSKFGIRVLPMEAKQENIQPSRSPKSAELSQNDNNINLEKKMVTENVGIDEVDKVKVTEEAPPVRRREKTSKSVDNTVKENMEQVVKTSETFERGTTLNESGIKRDKAGIPQEIPDHMMNAAVAARKNRRSSEMIDKTPDLDDSQEVKSPKKQKGKGKAPAPPEATKVENKTDSNEKIGNVSVRLNFTDNFDEISSLTEKQTKAEKNVTDINKNINQTDDTIAELKTESEKVAEDGKEYNSDSDVETDNQSSVNTIELNSSDITIHHSEGDADMKGRKTASTGDLSKIHKTRKTSTGTLERAQSLDITDSGIPPLTKKRKASKDDAESKLSDSDDSLYEKSVLKNKEPRLSLALENLDTFQRNRLKKSSEWGNLEDAIMTLDKMEVDTPVDMKVEFTESKSPITFNFGTKNTEFGNTVKINEEFVTQTNVNHNLNASLTDDKMLTDDMNNSLNANIEDVKVTVKNPLWPPFEVKEKLCVKEVVSHAEHECQGCALHAHKMHLKTESIIVTSTEKISEKQDIKNVDNALTDTKKNPEVKNNLWPSFDVSKTTPSEEVHSETHETQVIETKIKNTEMITSSTSTDIKHVPDVNNVSSTKINNLESSFSLKAQFQERINGKMKNNNEIVENNQESNTNNNVLPNITVKSQENSIFHPGKSSQNFIFAEKYASNNDSAYNFSSKLYDTNISDDIKVSRHSLGSLERPKSDVLKSVNKLKMQNLISSDQGGVSNITITENKQGYGNGVQNASENDTKDIRPDISFDMSTASELYTTAIDSTLDEKRNIEISTNPTNDIKNITITETNYDSNLHTDSPSSLTIDTSSDGPDSIKSHTLTYVTEIQVSTPTNGTPKNVSEVEVNMNKKSPNTDKKPEEVLKRLPEMKFTTSSYESAKVPEKRLSQIELLRSNFEKAAPKPKPIDLSPSKSRIPVATAKVDVKSSPERRDMKFGDQEVSDEREIVEIMSSAVHSTPIVSNQRLQNKNQTRNVTVTSIRTSSKIPSGSHISSYTNKPPVPARPTEYTETHEIRSSNGSSESFKQWVFNPGESSVTSIVVDNKEHHK